VKLNKKCNQQEIAFHLSNKCGEEKKERKKERKMEDKVEHVNVSKELSDS
jgi:hypothetical protein